MSHAAGRGGRFASRGLPEAFPPGEQRYALYEGVDYEEYWDDPTQKRQDALERQLICDFLPPHGHRIADIGCGYGRLFPCYARRFDEVVLLDGSMSLLRQAKEGTNGAVLVAGDLGRLPFRSAAFDAVLTIRVLQHVEDVEHTFAEMARVLSANGQGVFSYHNKRNIRRMLHYIASRRIANPFSHESAEVSPTLISHHPARIAAALEAAGLSAPEYRGAMTVDARPGRTGNGDPPGLGWARFTGRHTLAPWLIGRTRAIKQAAPTSDSLSDDLFECPSCRGPISRGESILKCTACGRKYPVVDGIIDFRV